MTNNRELATRMAELRSHGITRDPARMSWKPDGPWYYEQTELGFNYRMTDIQAALGLSQLSRLDDYVVRRHELADRYDELLADLPVATPVRYADCHSAFHLYVIRLRRDRTEAGFRSARLPRSRGLLRRGDQPASFPRVGTEHSVGSGGSVAGGLRVSRVADILARGGSNGH